MRKPSKICSRHTIDDVLLALQKMKTAILSRLAKTETKVMSKIAEFATRQNAFNERLDTAVAGVTEDVAGLKRLIEELQNTGGEITPEDQALLDAIEARSAAIATKLEALNDLTPPTPPTP